MLWNWQALSHIRQGNFNRAQIIAHQARELAERSDDQRGIATSLTNLGDVASHQGDYEQAQDY